MALIATLGAVDANSYVTELEADAYFLDRMHASAWSRKSQRQKYLITASQMLDWYINWKGDKSASTQSMQWPRSGAIRPDGTIIDDDALPPEIKTAVYELAFASITVDRTLDDPLAGIGQIQVSSLMIKAGPEKPKQTNNKVIPQQVYKIVSDLYNQGSGASVVRLLRA